MKEVENIPSDQQRHIRYNYRDSTIRDLRPYKYIQQDENNNSDKAHVHSKRAIKAHNMNGLHVIW